MIRKTNYIYMIATAEILSECKGSDIGVLVSGPRTLRHEVAKICSSGLVENVHFEAMSFNW